MKPMFHTIEDIYEVQLDTERGVKERVRIFDTAGVVSYKYEFFSIYVVLLFLVQWVHPLTPMSNQERISSYITNTISTR